MASNLVFSRFASTSPRSSACRATSSKRFSLFCCSYNAGSRPPLLRSGTGTTRIRLPLASKSSSPAGSGHIKRTPFALSGRCNKRLRVVRRSEEHTSELQSLMRTSYAVFCLKKKKHQYNKQKKHINQQTITLTKTHITHSKLSIRHETDPPTTHQQIQKNHNITYKRRKHSKDRNNEHANNNNNLQKTT